MIETWVPVVFGWTKLQMFWPHRTMATRPFGRSPNVAKTFSRTSHSLTREDLTWVCPTFRPFAHYYYAVPTVRQYTHIRLPTIKIFIISIHSAISSGLHRRSCPCNRWFVFGHSLLGTHCTVLRLGGTHYNHRPGGNY